MLKIAILLTLSTASAFTSLPSTTRFGHSLSSPFAQKAISSPISFPSTTSLAAGYTIGVVGATGAVGKEIVGVLEARQSDSSLTEKLRIFGSPRSQGSVVSTQFGDVTVELFDVDAARECDIVFLAVDGDFALANAEKISAPGGAVVIDNSSAFRLSPNVPLVIPEINGKITKTARLVANPNCTTAIGMMAMAPLHKEFGMKRMLMSTYQASSGAGVPGMEELRAGTKQVIDGVKDVADNEVFAHPLPFNVIPHIDKFQPNGYTKEEMKVTWETRKIFDLPDDFPVSCTAVRIPTYRAHSETIVMETEKKIDIERAWEVLRAAPGVKLVDDVKADPPLYPMPLTATGKYDVEVGRVRRSEAFGDNGVEFFVSGDQLLRGAALNAVLIGEEMATNGAI